MRLYRRPRLRPLHRRHHPIHLHPSWPSNSTHLNPSRLLQWHRNPSLRLSTHRPHSRRNIPIPIHRFSSSKCQPFHRRSRPVPRMFRLQTRFMPGMVGTCTGVDTCYLKATLSRDKDRPTEGW